MEKPRQHKATAGWRRGYAADCKAPQNPREINALGAKSYQDIAGTHREPDTARAGSFAPPENENPGALAGATGEPSNDQRITKKHYHAQSLKASWSRLEDRQKRAVRTFALALFLDDPHHWAKVPPIFVARLSPHERACLAFVAMRSLQPACMDTVLEALAAAGPSTAPPSNLRAAP